MKFEVAIAIAIGWFILRAISKTIKKNKASLQPGGQNTNISPNATQNFVDRDAQMAQQTAEVSDTEGHSLERIMQDNASRMIDPFLETRSLEDNADRRTHKVLEDTSQSHYNEDNLVTEYEQTHSEGKTVAHHRHQLFEEQKDRQKATRHTGATGKPQTARTHASTHSPAPGSAKRAERRKQSVHPIAAAMKGKAGLQQAFIMSELFKRPEF